MEHEHVSGIVVNSLEAAMWLVRMRAMVIGSHAGTRTLVASLLIAVVGSVEYELSRWATAFRTRDGAMFMQRCGTRNVISSSGPNPWVSLHMSFSHDLAVLRWFVVGSAGIAAYIS